MMDYTAKYFEANSEASYLYFTSDGIGFYRQQDAEAHAFGKKMTIQRITREMYAAWKNDNQSLLTQATAQAREEDAISEAQQKKAQAKATTGAMPSLAKDMNK